MWMTPIRLAASMPIGSKFDPILFSHITMGSKGDGVAQAQFGTNTFSKVPFGAVEISSRAAFGNLCNKDMKCNKDAGSDMYTS